MKLSVNRLQDIEDTLGNAFITNYYAEKLTCCHVHKVSTLYVL